MEVDKVAKVRVRKSKGIAAVRSSVHITFEYPAGPALYLDLYLSAAQARSLHKQLGRIKFIKQGE